MADLDLTQLIPSASPLAAAGIDPDEAIASGDPHGMLAAKRAGVPYIPKAAALTPTMPQVSAAIPQKPVQSASQTPDIPATVTPSGKAVSPQQETRRQFSAAAQSLLNRPSLESQLQPLQEQRTELSQPLSPYQPQYRPSAGERIMRGVQAFAKGGIRGALNPAAVGSTPYGAGNRQWSQAAQQRAAQLNDVNQRIADVNAEEKAGSERLKDISQLGKSDAAQDTAGTKQQAIYGQLGKAGLKPITDENGQIIGVEDDPDSEAFKGRQVMNDLHQAQTAQAQANAELKAAENDKGSPAYQLALQKSRTAAANASAAAERAQAYMGNYLMHAKGVGLDNQELPGMTELPGGTPVGTAAAKSVTTHEQNVAQFNDVLGATDNLEKSARALVSKHGKGALSDSVIAAGLSEPKGTFGQWVQGQVANGNMTPEQRDYVTNLRAYRENLQALRKSVGGGVSDAQVNRLMEMAPGASTPDLDYLLRQTGQIRNTANRLSKGIPNVAGGTKVEGGGSNSGMPPQSVVDGMKEGQYVHGPHGESFQKKGGKLVEVGK